MTKVAINIKRFTKLENIVHGPCPVHNTPKLWNKMHTMLNLTDRNDRCMPMMMVRKP